MTQNAARTLSEIYQGLACHRLTLPCGDTVLVAEQGAHVLSWQSLGRERLFLSPANAWDGRSAIRGGVPVCFPQFNQRGNLPKHGFARNTPWQLSPATALQASANTEAAQLEFTLRSNAHTLAIWPQDFVATLCVTLAPGQLTLTLRVDNTAPSEALPFTGALHTYLAVDDIDLAELRGLGGCAEWDAVADFHGVGDTALYFDGEFDRVYTRGAGATGTSSAASTNARDGEANVAPQALQLQDGSSRLQIAQSPTWANTVVWNPGERLSDTLADMPPQGFARMLCVEAAQVFEPIVIPAGGHWVGWQRLSAL